MTTITHELPSHIKEIIFNARKGVGYYNIDNKENKDKKNNYANDDAFGTPHLLDNSVGSLSLGIASSEAQEDIGSFCSSEILGLDSGPRPIFDDIKTAIIQLFDNGENTRQRYKVKVRINLTDKQNPEFIANLTKDFRNFQKYIPEECREFIIHEADEIRKHVQKTYGTKPYLGKFHFHSGEASRQIEPYTFVAVWWNEQERGWSGMLMIHDWIHHFDLFTDYLTDNQKKAGVKCQDTYTHPKHRKARPLTWAQRQAQKDVGKK
jgi:hypothetical protein